MSELLTIATATELTETEIDNALQLVADAEAVDRMKARRSCCATASARRPHPTTRHVLVSEVSSCGGTPSWSPGSTGAPASPWSLRAIGSEALAPCCCSG